MNLSKTGRGASVLKDTAIRSGTTQRCFAGAVAVAAVVLALAAQASAFEGGARKPSEAPQILVGQHYTGQLNNHEDDSNYSGFREVALWHLPPLATRDVVTIDWDAAPYTGEPGNFPVCLAVAQGITDFNWGERFSESLENNHCYRLSGSGSAHTEIVAQEASSTTSYLEFSSYANYDEPSKYETYPYSFTVQPILHYLAVALRSVKRVSAGGILHATANLATGVAAPDGLPFTLTVTWPGGGVATYSATSLGGLIGFQLALPETAYGKQATFVVSHPADGTYQGITTENRQILVAKPKPAPPSPCLLAERRVVSLRAQYSRLRARAARARGASRGFLHRRAAHAKRRLRGARAQANKECAGV